jgi:hypothetical protein
VRLEGLGNLKKIHFIGTRTRDLPACSKFEYSVSNYREYIYIFHKRCTNFVLYIIVYVCTIIFPVVLRGKEAPDIEGKV